MDTTALQTTPDTFVDLSPDKKLPGDGNKDIPIQSLIAYRKKKLSYQEVADLVGCSKQNVYERLQTVGYVQQDVDNYKENKADTFAFLQQKLVNSLDDKTIKEMYPYQRVVAIGILNDKERMERGLTTEKIDISISVSKIEELRRKEEELIRTIEARVVQDVVPKKEDVKQ